MHKPAKPADEPKQSPHLRHYLSTLRRMAEVAAEGPAAERYAERMVNLSTAAARQRALLTDEERISIDLP